MSRVRIEATLLALAFLDLLGFGMLIPDIQIRLDGMGSPGWMIGVVLSSMFVAQILISPFWGRLSDRVGRKPIVVTCTFISALAMAVYGLATNPAWILASRVLAGVGAANIAIAQAYVADLDASGSKVTAMGRISAAISAGLIAGPAIGGWLAAAGGNRILGFVAASASALGGLAALFLLPKVQPSPREERPRATLQLLKEVPGLRRLFFVIAMGWLALATLEGTFGRLIKDNLGLGTGEFGTIFAYESLLSLIIQSALLSKIQKLGGASAILRFSYVVMGVGLLVFPFSPGLWALFIGSTLYASGSAIANPTANALCSDLTPVERQGELFGLMQSATRFGFIVGPVIGGRLFDMWHAGPYLMAALVCGAAAAAVPSFRGTQRV